LFTLSEDALSLFHESVFIFLNGATMGFSTNSISLFDASFNHSQVNGKYLNIHINVRLYAIVTNKVKIYPPLKKYETLLKPLDCNE
jgi:hypothetical protein